MSNSRLASRLTSNRLEGKGADTETNTSVEKRPHFIGHKAKQEQTEFKEKEKVTFQPRKRINEEAEKQPEQKKSVFGHFQKNKEPQEVYSENLLFGMQKSEEEIEAEELRESAAEQKREARHLRMVRVMNAIIILGCVYLIMLIYGVFMTEYAYNANGEIEPQILSVEELREKKNFDVIKAEYLKCRKLYEMTLLLDNRIDMQIEDPILIAPEYESLLEKNKNINVSNLANKLQTLPTDKKYEQIKSMMIEWLNQDMGYYLSVCSVAYSTGNEDAYASASEYRQITYSDFSVITQNVATIGQSIYGVDMEDILTWTPESYVDEAINGKGEPADE